MEQIKTNKNTPKNAGRLFFILMILTIPISLIYSVLCGFIPTEYQSLASILISQGYLLITALIYLKVTNTNIIRDLNLRKYKFSSFLLSILFLIAATPMSTLLNLLSQLFAQNQISDTMSDITKMFPPLVGIFVIGCLPGFIEELIYRGILFSAFKKHSVILGILVSCLSFGLMHGNFNQIPYAIYLGALFTHLVEATGSLASSMVLHILFNGMNVLYLYILPGFYELLGQYDPKYANVNIDDLFSNTPNKDELLSNAISMIPAAVIGLFLAILILKHIAKLNGNSLTLKGLCEKKQTDHPEKPVNGWLIAGWVVCILLALLNLLAQG